MDAGDEAPAGEGLAVRLGADRAAVVRAVLRDRALAWARGIAPGDRILSAEPEEELVTAAQRAFSAFGGPLLIAWPELAVWRPVHGEGALGDLADGCGVAVGPIFDGGFYLLAFADPLAALLEVPRSLGCAAPRTWRRRWPIRCSTMSCGAYSASLTARGARAIHWGVV